MKHLLLAALLLGLASCSDCRQPAPAGGGGEVSGRYIGSMKKLLLSALLLAGLAGCGGGGHLPDGSRFYGPKQLDVRNTGADYVLSYKLEGFRPEYPNIRSYLKGVALGAVREHDKTGLYDVMFTDKSSGKLLVTVRFRAVGDLFMSNKIEFLQVVE